MPTARLTLTALLLSLAMCATAVAVPRNPRDVGAHSGLKGTHVASAASQRSPDARHAAEQRRIGLAVERYYSSYGSPEPIAAPRPAPAPVPDDGTPWIVFALVAAVALAIGTQLHRLRPHRRTARALS
jgi:hypothetical protein